VNSLARALGPQLTIVNREYQTTQMFRVSDTGPDAPLHHLDGPPDVEIEITLNPPEKRTHAKILVADEKRNPVLARPRGTDPGASPREGASGNV
jgi:hypothetical protein